MRSNHPAASILGQLAGVLVRGLVGVFWIGFLASLVQGQEQPLELPPIRVIGTQPQQPTGPQPTPEVSPPAAAAPAQPLPLTQSGRTLPVENIVGSPTSASQGTITQTDLQYLPLLRTTEFLEQVPGLLVTQHSSTLKANQYFLRGFSLDHGTDFAGFVDDVPYNLPTQAHGQGYLDLNSVIPEIVDRIDFRKGPYYADVGDFSSTGSANIHYMDRMPYGIVKIEAGKWDWERTVVANSVDVGQGSLLYAVEYNHYNGPYQVPEHDYRISGVLRYTLGDTDDGLRLTAQAYNGSGNANDQIPLRAVHEGLTSSLGNLDPSDFITTDRYTLNGQWWHRGDDGSLTQANVYTYYYSLNLFSNFTFFLRDPVNGDQIDQIDRRWVSGSNLSHQWNSWLFGDSVVNTVGLQLRNDDIPEVGLHHTAQRNLINPISDDSVDEMSTGVYFNNQIKWSAKIRTVLGAREDYYHYDVTARDTPVDSGHSEAKLFSPKGSLILGPWDKTDFYLSAGYSFHSNDVRGALATLAPSFTANGVATPQQPVPALVPSRGIEVGTRTQLIPHLTSELALWELHLGQELVFDGDTGTTTPLRASDRVGIEWSNTYHVNPWLTFDGDYTWSHGRLLGIDPTTPGQYIPESLTTVFSGGPTLRLPSGWFADLRFRYMGPRPLIEDNSASSRATQLFELGMGYECQRYTAGVEFLNLFNSNGHDIDYYYGTGLKTDPGFPFPPGSNGVNDINFKQVEPFAVRVYYTLKW